MFGGPNYGRRTPHPQPEPFAIVQNMGNGIHRAHMFAVRTAICREAGIQVEVLQLIPQPNRIGIVIGKTFDADMLVEYKVHDGWLGRIGRSRGSSSPRQSGATGCCLPDREGS